MKLNKNDTPGIPGGRIPDLVVTLACWSWFILGFLFIYSWWYLLAALLRKDTEKRFQSLNSSFFRVFFKILQFFAPSQKIDIAEEIQEIRSAVIVCNHISYLDPLLLVATFAKQKTIVKARFFDMVIFGRMITKSGYLPDSTKGRFSSMMIDQMEAMESFLKEGGNLFIFPEGTRSRDGKLGGLNPGALKIARLCKAPIYFLRVKNTEKLFTPGKFLFNSRPKNTISLQLIGSIDPEKNAQMSSAQLLEQMRKTFSNPDSP